MVGEEAGIGAVEGRTETLVGGEGGVGPMDSREDQTVTVTSGEAGQGDAGAVSAAGSAIDTVPGPRTSWRRYLG